MPWISAPMIGEMGRMSSWVATAIGPVCPTGVLGSTGAGRPGVG